jgi:DNA-binding response OmpR family regulator
MSERRTAILVAEDEPSARGALQLVLGDEGFDVQVASDGIEALEKLEVFKPDIFLLDVQMPRLDGIGFFRQARERLPHTKAIFMTGLSERTLAVSGLIDEPTVFFINKPVDVDELLALLSRML